MKQDIEFSEKMVNELQRMESAAKTAFLRKALTGDRGLISSKEHRSKFLRQLVRTAIESGNESDLRTMIERVVTALGDIDEWKIAYFALQTVLADKMAIPTPSPAKWQTLPLVVEKLRTDFSPEEFKMLAAKGGLFDAISLKKVTAAHGRMPWRYETGLLRYGENILKEELEKRGIKTPHAETAKMSPLGFIIELVENTGSLGVRFLQLLPQFAKLDPRYLGELSRVYDCVYGQSKLTALALLEDEWPGFWDDIRAIEERVGGGSLMTVYKVKTAEGKDEVVKVLNPNLEYFLKDRAEFIDKVLLALEKRYGKEYEGARHVLEDVKAWIGRDVNFEGFLEKDKVFRDGGEINGRPIEGNSGFSADGLDYSIYVPKSSGPSSKYFMREEYIEGRNLTEWDALRAEGHDMKAIVSLILRNYMKQLQDGLVHSDVHVGNFRVTVDKETGAKKVAILDRSFFLEIGAKPDMQKLVNEVFLNPAALLTITAKGLYGKVLKVSETKEFTPAQEERIIRAIDTFLKDVRESAGDLTTIGTLLVALRQNGIKLPLEMTLIFKNLNSLTDMAKRAGFSNIIEAYLYPETKAGQIGPSAELRTDAEQRRSIGKRAKGEITADGRLKVIDSKGREHVQDVELKGKIDITAAIAEIGRLDGVDDGHKSLILDILKLHENSPPQLAIFSDLIEDFIGRAFPRQIILHKDFAANLIARFHEIFEYLANNGSIKLTLSADRSKLNITHGNKTETIDVSGAIEDLAGDGEDWATLGADILNKGDAHYLLRIMQRAIFEQYDKALTRLIQQAQERKVYRQSKIDLAKTIIEKVNKQLSEGRSVDWEGVLRRFYYYNLTEESIVRDFLESHKILPDFLRHIYAFRNIYEGRTGREVTSQALEAAVNAGPTGRNWLWDLYPAQMRHRVIERLNAVDKEALADFILEILNRKAGFGAEFRKEDIVSISIKGSYAYALSEDTAPTDIDLTVIVRNLDRTRTAFNTPLKDAAGDIFSGRARHIPQSADIIYLCEPQDSVTEEPYSEAISHSTLCWGSNIVVYGEDLYTRRPSKETLLVKALQLLANGLFFYMEEPAEEFPPEIRLGKILKRVVEANAILKQLDRSIDFDWPGIEEILGYYQEYRRKANEPADLSLPYRIREELRVKAAAEAEKEFLERMKGVFYRTYGRAARVAGLLEKADSRFMDGIAVQMDMMRSRLDNIFGRVTAERLADIGRDKVLSLIHQAVSAQGKAAEETAGAAAKKPAEQDMAAKRPAGAEAPLTAIGREKELAELVAAHPELGAALAKVTKDITGDDVDRMKNVFMYIAQVYTMLPNILDNTRQFEDQRFVFVPISKNLCGVELSSVRRDMQAVERVVKELLRHRGFINVEITFYDGAIDNLLAKKPKEADASNALAYVDKKELEKLTAKDREALGMNIVQENAPQDGPGYISIGGHVVLALALLDLLRNARSEDSTYMRDIINLISTVTRNKTNYQGTSKEQFIEKLKKGELELDLPPIGKEKIDERMREFSVTEIAVGSAA